ncbi:MAG: restriction endonuclease, partial [Rhodobacteraceae bacterium]|nr:restriction endonuclease [Paracoccaceae bacterium]
MVNHLYYGDNLPVLRESIADASVDLIYPDPPFNSNVSYNVLFRGPAGTDSPAQIEAFDDTWHWDDMVSGQALIELRDSPYQDAARMLDAMIGFLGKNRMTAYLAMMAVRLVELHRVLKPTGSLYLHCDPTASHYLKLLLDAVFGARNFINEIIWHYDGPQGPSRRRFGSKHDVIFRYGKTDAYFSDPKGIAPFKPLSEKELCRYKKLPDGRYFYTTPRGSYTDQSIERLASEDRIEYTKNGKVRVRHFLPTDCSGTVGRAKQLPDVWTDIVSLGHAGGNEKLGYPTQKPVALLERIIAASSNPGDLVLDPFCGCGTTLEAAENLGRKWYGIDITYLAIGVIETRLFNAFGDEAGYTVHGVPADIDGARNFFDRDDRTKKEFEKWAVSLLRGYAQASGKKGADGGVDGFFRFGRDREHTAIISVKGGKALGVPMIRELDAVVLARKAQIGIFLTLHPPTRPMRDWAAQAGTFQVEGFAPVPRLQIVTIEDAMERGVRAVDTPLRHGSELGKAVREDDTTAQNRM